MAFVDLELAYKLLASLPRSRLATIQRRLAPLLQFDVVGVRQFFSLECTACASPEGVIVESDSDLVFRRYQQKYPSRSSRTSQRTHS